MRKGVLKEIIFTSVNGSRPSTDSPILREDIEALIPAAINYAITGDYWARLKNDGDRELPNGFVTELILADFEFDQIGREFVKMEQPLINVAGNGGVRYVMDQCGNTYAPRALGTSAGSFWDKALQHNKEYQYLEKKIFPINKDPLASALVVGIIVDSSQLSDEDELPIPAGSEPEVIDMLKNFFTDQRMQPKDYVINGVDPVNEVR